MVSLVAEPPDDTVNVPPIVPPLSVPNTTSTPPLLIVPDVSFPMTVSDPPAEIITKFAWPPELTISWPPLLTTVEETVPPELATS